VFSSRTTCLCEHDAARAAAGRATQGSGLTDKLWLDRSWRRSTISLWDYPSAVKTARWMGQEVLEEPPQPPSPVGVSLCRSPHQSPQHQSPPRCLLNTSSASHSAFVTADTRPTIFVAADTRIASNVQPSTRSLHYPKNYIHEHASSLSPQSSPTTPFCPLFTVTMGLIEKLQASTSGSLSLSLSCTTNRASRT
jgi:hypothetical protein